MEKFVIRQYVEQDWSAICELHDRARPLELKNSCDQKAFIPLADDTDEHQNFTNSIKYSAFIGNQLAGFVGFKDNEITWLYVEPEFHGMGFGRQLLRKVLSKIPDSAFLYVLGNNTTALALYKSEGFTIARQFQSKVNGYDCNVIHLSQ